MLGWGRAQSTIQVESRLFLKVLRIFLFSRLVFYLAAFTGEWVLPTASIQPGQVDVKGSLALALHWRWDAIHYYAIALSGYTASPVTTPPASSPDQLPAFFPLLPVLIRAGTIVLGGGHPPAQVPIMAADFRTLLAGVLVTSVATFLAFYLLYQLVLVESGNEAVASRAILYASIFPLGFYYAVPYTEPLFLATSVGAFLEMRRGRWDRAGLWVAAASATRLAGLILVPILVLEIVFAARRGDLRSNDRFWALIGVFISPLGLVFFMIYLWWNVGNPLAFLGSQSLWSREWSFPLSTLLSAIFQIFQPGLNPTTASYARNVLQTLIVLGFLTVLVASLRQWRFAFTLYGILLFTMFLSSTIPGQPMLSNGRYAMVFFPVYITLAHWGRRTTVHYAIVLSWLTLFSLLTALFTHWYFIA